MAERRSRRSARRLSDGRMTSTNANGLRQSTSPRMQNLAEIGRRFGAGGSRNAGLNYNYGQGRFQGTSGS